MAITDWPSEERPREKLLLKGAPFPLRCRIAGNFPAYRATGNHCGRPVSTITHRLWILTRPVNSSPERIL